MARSKRYDPARASRNPWSRLPAAARSLTDDHPDLVELERRYRALGDPPAGDWGSHGVTPYFRGDNDYVWQYRYFASDFRRRLRAYASYVHERDELGAWSRCREDGAFGAYTILFRGRRISRDLVDSVHQLNWVCRQVPELRTSTVRAVDVGAGYGRLAHRIEEVFGASWPTISTDGIARSTFLCEFYLGVRGCEHAAVVPADRIEGHLPDWAPTIAFNIHSFSEMRRASIEWWLRLLAASGCRHLLVVTNETDRVIRCLEADGTRPDVTHVFADHGYRLAVQEPYVLDDEVRERTNVRNHFALFELARP